MSSEPLLLASAGGDLHCWYPATMREKSKTQNDDFDFNVCAFSPDALTLAAGPAASTSVAILTLECTLIKTIDVADEPVKLVWHPDGNSLIVAALNGGVHVLDVNSGSIIASLAVNGSRPNQRLASIAVSSDGNLIASSSSASYRERGCVPYNSVRLWSGSNFSSKKERSVVVCDYYRSMKSRHLAREVTKTRDVRAALEQYGEGYFCADPRHVAFFSDSTRLVVGFGADKTARIFNVTGGQLQHVMALVHDGDVNAVAVASDGTIATSCCVKRGDPYPDDDEDDDGQGVYEYEDDEDEDDEDDYSSHSENSRPVDDDDGGESNPDDDSSSGSGTVVRGRTKILLWSAEGINLRVLMGRQDDTISSLSFSCDCRLLAAASESDLTTVVWDVGIGQELRVEHEYQASCVAFPPAPVSAAPVAATASSSAVSKSVAQKRHKSSGRRRGKRDD